MSNPKYVKLDDKLYKINTDFRVAIECNKIAQDTEIGDTERAMAIIYKLFGEEGLNCNNMPKLLDLGSNYINLLAGEQKGLKNENKEDFELDISKCEGLIRSSFKFDYNYDPYELEYLHWYDFYNDLANLSTSEFGNCCILNRIVSTLNQDEKQIKDSKDRKKLIDAKKMLKEKYCLIKEKKITKKQEQSAEDLYKALGII